jgi:mono/diheme cytochrome c family protein
MIRSTWRAGGALLLALTAGAAQAADGRTLYVENCAACHRPNGVGVPGAFPALVGSKVANGETREAARIVLEGRGGMPAFQGEMDDEELAAALTYVRSSWGNKAKPVQTADVGAVRGKARREDARASLQAH